MNAKELDKRRRKSHVMTDVYRLAWKWAKTEELLMAEQDEYTDALDFDFLCPDGILAMFRALVAAKTKIESLESANDTLRVLLEKAEARLNTPLENHNAP